MARKKTQKTRKLKQKMLEPPSSQLPTPAMKISEAILILCEPLRNRYSEHHHIQAIIFLTVMAWNISLFPEEEQVHVQGMLIDALPKQLNGEDVSVFLENIDKLIER
ncbi:MAG: hypothetical protein WCA35_08840, partial [Kovacikia sp.]